MQNRVASQEKTGCLYCEESLIGEKLRRLKLLPTHHVRPGQDPRDLDCHLKNQATDLISSEKYNEKCSESTPQGRI